jgi:hypothetical protein
MSEQQIFSAKDEERCTNTTTYTKSQFVTIATAEPVFRMCCELISDGYMKGMDKNESPYYCQYILLKSLVRCTNVKDIVKEDESDC